MRADVRQLLLGVTPRQRAALVLVDLLGYSSEQAAHIMRVRPSTVRALATQGRRALRGRKERGMPDVQEVFRMATEKIDQEPGALDRQVSRQRRRARNRKIDAIALVAALGVVLVAFALATLPDRGPRPADTTTPVPINTTPPIGAQIVSLDGTVLRQLPGSFSDAANLQLSPNGTTLAFYRNNAVDDDATRRDQRPGPHRTGPRSGRPPRGSFLVTGRIEDRVLVG